MLAAIGLDDVIRIVIIVVFFLAPIISQIGKAAKKEPPKRERRRTPQRPMPPRQAAEPVAHLPREPQPGGAADLGDRLQAEIDEFLQRRQGGPPAGKLAPEPAAELDTLRPDVEVVQTPRVRPLEEAARTVDKGPTAGESVAEHVRQHLSTAEFRRRTEHIADDLEHADEKLEAHLKDVFQHPIGNLAEQSVAENQLAQGTDAKVWESTTDRARQKREAAAKRASDLITMLRDPINIRSSVILSEILKRPNFDELDLPRPPDRENR